MLHLDIVRSLSRELLDPSWGGQFGRPRRHYGPITTADYRAGLVVVRELAEHTASVPAAGWRWWWELLTWIDDNGDPVAIDGTRRIVTGAIVARDAAVPAAGINAGRLREDEAMRVAAVLTAARDAIYRPLLDMCAEYSALAVKAYASIPPEHQEASRIAEVSADAAVCALAAGPLIPAPTLATRVEVEALALAEHDPRILETVAWRPILTTPYECPRCQNVWIPRVVQPKRCPRCQVTLVWTAAAS